MYRWYDKRQPPSPLCLCSPCNRAIDQSKSTHFTPCIFLPSFVLFFLASLGHDKSQEIYIPANTLHCQTTAETSLFCSSLFVEPLLVNMTTPLKFASRLAIVVVAMANHMFCRCGNMELDPLKPPKGESALRLQRCSAIFVTNSLLPPPPPRCMSHIGSVWKE